MVLVGEGHRGSALVKETAGMACPPRITGLVEVEV